MWTGALSGSNHRGRCSRHTGECCKSCNCCERRIPSVEANPNHPGSFVNLKSFLIFTENLTVINNPPLDLPTLYLFDGTLSSNKYRIFLVKRMQLTPGRF